MKKFFLILMVCAAALSPAGAESFNEINWGEKFALYLPNRVLDILDTFTCTLGCGAVAEARLMGTRYCDVGAGISARTFKVYKDFNRQYGVGVEEGWYWSLISIGEEEYCIVDGSSLIDKYSESRTGIPMPEMRAYDYFSGPRDFWALGGALGAGLDGTLYIHPIEWLDCFLGFFFVDIRDDDLSFDDFNR